MSFKVYVDWEDNNQFTDGIDDISADVMEISWRLGMRNAFQPVADEMTCQIQVKNADGKYNPENSSGTLFGYLLPQRRVKIEYVSGGTTAMYYGYLEFPEVKWRPAGTQTGKETAMLHGVGSKHLLEDNQVTLELYENVTGDEIILDVLNASTLPASVSNRWVLGESGRSELNSTTYLGDETDYSDLETGLTTFEYYGDSSPSSAWQVIDEVTMAEQGRFFFARDGKATWWNRTHLMSVTSNSGTVDTSSTNKPTKLDYTYGTQLVNVVKVESHPRQVSASETLWELDNAIEINPNETIQFEARLRKSSGQFAGASSLTATPTFSQGTATVTVTPLGGKAKVLVTESSGAQATLSALTIAGAPVVQQNDLAVEIDDVTSVSTYGRRSLTVNLGPISDYATARGIADYILLQRKDARGEVNSLEFVRKQDGSDDSMLLDWPIGTRINVTDAGLEHDADYFVIGEEHKWTPGEGGGVHYGTLHLEPADSSDVWVLGVTNRSELNSTTYLA